MKLLITASPLALERTSDPLGVSQTVIDDDDRSTMPVEERCAITAKYRPSATAPSKKKVSFDLERNREYDAASTAIATVVPDNDRWYGASDFEEFRALVRQQAKEFIPPPTSERQQQDATPLWCRCSFVRLLERLNSASIDVGASVVMAASSMPGRDDNILPEMNEAPSAFFASTSAESLFQSSLSCFYARDDLFGLEHRAIRVLSKCRKQRKRRIVDAVLDLQRQGEDEEEDCFQFVGGGNQQNLLRNVSKAISLPALLLAQARAHALALAVTMDDHVVDERLLFYFE